MDRSTIIRTAIDAAIAATVAHVAAHPHVSMAQALYCARAADVLTGHLAPLHALPAEQVPHIVTSSACRTDALYSAFSKAVESGRLVQAGWRAGHAVYRCAQ